MFSRWYKKGLKIIDEAADGGLFFLSKMDGFRIQQRRAPLEQVVGEFE
jgi:hypothetical protein